MYNVHMYIKVACDPNGGYIYCISSPLHLSLSYLQIYSSPLPLPAGLIDCNLGPEVTLSYLQQKTFIVFTRLYIMRRGEGCTVHGIPGLENKRKSSH